MMIFRGKRKEESGKRFDWMQKGIWYSLSSFLFLLSTLLLASCEKEIDIDYRSVEPIYVVEASVSNDGMTARVSQTQDMDDNHTTSDITDASIVITGSDGSVTKLIHKKNGIYQSAAKGLVGVTYQINVEVDSHHFTSTSTMQQMPKINQFHFIWKKIMSERFLVGELLFQDTPNEDNWYFAHIYRNNIGFRWAVKRDDQNPNKELQQYFSIAREGSNDKDMLVEGDKLRIELRAIDQQAYDYLYSMQIMDNTNTNPVQNFTGGCLGYFSAYSQVVVNYVYHEADVDEEE
ncbi:MAG: DUF4249 domain-containing protein [Prevotella sp.]|nr:DUF4249 domain-containing protein [Prevotella sp.]